MKRVYKPWSLATFEISGNTWMLAPRRIRRIHQWSAGSVRHKLTYKAERLGMMVELQDEHATSKTCPVCEHKRKTSPSGRVFTCTKKECKWQYHRDGVGAINIRRKYLGLGPVVGAMAPPTGMRFRHHSSRSSFGKPGEKFDPGNREEAAGLSSMRSVTKEQKAAYYKLLNQVQEPLQ